MNSSTTSSFILFIFVFFSQSIQTLSQAQERLIEVPLESKIFDFYGPRVHQPIRFNLNEKDFKGTTGFGSETYIGSIILDYQQYYYSEYLKGNYTKDRFQSIMNIYKLDTVNVIKGYTKSFVSVLVALNGSKKIIVVDKNNDYDFSNDNIYTYDKFDKSLLDKNFLINGCPSIPVEYEKTSNGQIFKKLKYIKVNPFDSEWRFKDELDNRRQVFISNGRIKRGIFNYQNNSYEILISFPDQFVNESVENSFFQINGILESYDNHKWVSSNKSKILDGHEFKLIEIKDGEDTAKISILPSSRMP